MYKISDGFDLIIFIIAIVNIFVDSLYIKVTLIIFIFISYYYKNIENIDMDIDEILERSLYDDEIEYWKYEDMLQKIQNKSMQYNWLFQYVAFKKLEKIKKELFKCVIKNG